MIIIIFTLAIIAAFFLSKSYRSFERYYSTVQYVTLISLVYPLVCRGYMMWRFPNLGIFTDKVNLLFQAALLLPATTVIFLRYLPRAVWSKTLYFLGFVGLYTVMEWLLVARKEIIYAHGWNIGWSIFVDVCMFAVMWIHDRNWKAAVSISGLVLIFLVVWFRVPIEG